LSWGGAHLRRILRSYCRYYYEIRTHRSLSKDAPQYWSAHGTRLLTTTNRIACEILLVAKVRSVLMFHIHRFGSEQG
jgi:hypothetical protein